MLKNISDFLFKILPISFNGSCQTWTELAYFIKQNYLLAYLLPRLGSFLDLDLAQVKIVVSI